MDNKDEVNASEPESPDIHYSGETQNNKTMKSSNPVRLIILLFMLAVSICFLGFTILQGGGSHFGTFGRMVQYSPAFAGNGTERRPYRISTAEDLARIATMVNNGSAFAGRHFILTNDIDLTGFLSVDGAGHNNGAGWCQIGRHDRLPFSGYFDGAGHTVSGLWISRGSEPYIGLFGFIDNAKIRNLHVEIAEGKAVTGGVSIGVLVGLSYGGVIENSSVSGTIRVETRESAVVGGMVGSAFAEAIILNSEANVNIYADLTSENGRISAGGLVGALYQNSSITNSIARGNITATGSRSNAGGLVGHQGGLESILRGNSTITDSIARGDVTATGFAPIAGGLVGSQVSGSVINCKSYSMVTSNAPFTTEEDAIASGGGLVGFMGYYDTATFIIVMYSSASGNVSVSGHFAAAGGLVGSQLSGKIANSYAAGNVSATGSMERSSTAVPGGLVGFSDKGTIIKNCFATGRVCASGFSVFTGGLLGIVLGDVENSYFDIDTTGQQFGSGYREFVLPDITAVAKNTPEMMKQETFTGWDFENIWDILEGESYPFLRRASERGM